MAPTRLVAPIFERAVEVNAKLVLVGDPRQLPEIGAGGLLSGLAARVPPIELTENRRQRNEWERVALDNCGPATSARRSRRTNRTTVCAPMRLRATPRLTSSTTG